MKKNNRIVFIGCGTGRCGTTSLAKLINGCEYAICKHELRPLLPWVFNEELFQDRVKWFSTSTAGITGDVAYFYLPYLERLIDVLPHLKVLCIERDRQAVIDSFTWKTQWRNRWCHHDGSKWAKDTVWDKTFPKYNLPDKAEAISVYWDEYRKEIRRIAGKFPQNVDIRSIEELNTTPGQQKIFDFIGIPEKNRRYITKPRYNARHSGNRAWPKEEAFKWMQQLALISEDIASMIQPNTNFILVDQEQVRDYIPQQYHAVPFLERNGIYWGPPPDDKIAIRECNRLRQSGAQFIIFAWTAFWWLDYFTGLKRYLTSKFKCILVNSRLVIFDLQT
jgi:hypothetical protein